MLSVSLAGQAAAQQPTPSGRVTEEVTVTGSLLQGTGMATPTPVTALSSDELDVLAPGQMVEAIAALPQFLDNHLPDDGGAFSTTAGQSFVNLRGIGSNRMLVLLDGRRVVPSSQQGGVNINLFPKAVIQRVEVVTGGASAAYGSDAVTGVANFILNRDYQGIDAHVQTGATSRRDRDTYEGSLGGGFDVGRRGHMLISADHFHSDGVFGWDNRDWMQSYSELDNPNGTPAEITVPNARTTLYTYGGLIPSGPLRGTTFRSDGTPATFRRGDIVDPPFTQSGGDGVDPLIENEIYPETKRNGGFLYFDYDVTDNITAFAQAMYGQSTVQYLVSELRLYSPFGTQATIFRDNAYLPESIQTAMDDAGIESFSFHRMSSFDDWTDVEYTQNTTKAYTVGVDAALGEWQFNTYLQYGRNKRLLEGYQARLDRIYQALDAVVDPATGRIVCRSTLTDRGDGCEPLNLFGRGQMSDEARDYVLDTKVGYMLTTQRYAEFSADRLVLPDRSAGPIGVATGASYREDTMFADVLPPGLSGMPTLAEVNYRGLPARQAGSPFIFQQANMLVTSGGYDVREVFAESLVPLVARRAAAQSLSVDLAARYADYSGSGGILAWKGGLDWQITPGFRFRATRSRDIRAANLGERFDQQKTDGSYDDPWLGTEHTPVERTVSGGNPSVDPEKSDTSTFGIVFQPSGLQGLDMSVDWYDVQIKDAIDQVGGQQIIDLCYQEGSFCNLLKQAPSTGEILRVDNIFVNLVQANVTGVDFELGYRKSLGAGALNFRFLGSYLGEHSFTDQFGNKVDSAGETADSSLPEWQGVFNAGYSRGPFNIVINERYIGSGVRDLTEVEGIDIDDNSVDAVWYTNLRFSYDIETGGGSMQVFANVENLFDRDPPLAPGGFSFFSGSHQTNANLFDTLGRRFTLGVRFRL